ncbi:MAG: hypothetical protein KC519_21045 [Anaerolineae bacterium]|nr:hypothetical protein [Anaerolineae bacterium]
MMQITASTNTDKSIRRQVLSKPLASKLIIAVVMALVWWGVIFALKPLNALNVLTDQYGIFLPAARMVQDPFQVAGYFNPPWTAALLLPFSLLPEPLAVLFQLIVYFVLIALVIHRFGGSRGAVLLALTSFVAFDSALELNIEWMVCIGLLLPARWSMPFLLVKPQTAFGYYLGIDWRETLRAALVAALVIGLSLLIWPDWITQMIDQIRSGALTARTYNLAPMSLVGAPVSVLIGLFLAWRAVKRRDPVLSIFAWVFFVPYLALYGVLLHLALLAIRLPRVALIISLVLWVIYGGMMASHLVNVIAR